MNIRWAALEFWVLSLAFWILSFRFCGALSCLGARAEGGGSGSRWAKH